MTQLTSTNPTDPHPFSDTGGHREEEPTLCLFLDKDTGGTCSRYMTHDQFDQASKWWSAYKNEEGGENDKTCDFAGRQWTARNSQTAWMSVGVSSLPNWSTGLCSSGDEGGIVDTITRGAPDITLKLAQLNLTHDDPTAKAEAVNLALQLRVDTVASSCAEAEADYTEDFGHVDSQGSPSSRYQPPRSVCYFGGKDTRYDGKVAPVCLSASEYIKTAARWAKVYGQGTKVDGNVTSTSSGAPLSYRPLGGLGSEIEGHEGIRSLIDMTCTSIVGGLIPEELATLTDGQSHTWEDYVEAHEKVLDLVVEAYSSIAENLVLKIIDAAETSHGTEGVSDQNAGEGEDTWGRERDSRGRREE